MSAEPSGGWITPPPSDGTAVWSSEEYSSPIESVYLTNTGYTGYSSYPRTANFGYAPAYPYYASATTTLDVDARAALPPYWPRPVTVLAIDGFAITALIFGIIGGWIFGLGFGIAALRRIAMGTRRGRGLALAGMALSVAWFVATVVVVALRR